VMGRPYSVFGQRLSALAVLKKEPREPEPPGFLDSRFRIPDSLVFPKPARGESSLRQR
jgi:hypothetical protein